MTQLMVAHDPPLGAPPTVGIEKERVDPRTLQLLEHLFPGHRGLEFLAKFLRMATAKQLALPELDILDTIDVAVVTTQSLRALAKAIGISYDTTEKYIIVLSHLRLLYKKRYRNQIVLHFPLRLCQLPEPETLDTLCGYRPKVQSFAHQVKRRFVVIRQNGQLIPTIAATPSTVAPQLSPSILDKIHQIITTEVDSETASRLSAKIEEALSSHSLTSQSRLSSINGDFSEQTNVIDSSRQLGKSPILPPKGDSLEGVVSPQSLHSSKNGDSLTPPTITRSCLSLQKGNFQSQATEQKSPILTPKGDSANSTPVKNGRLLPQKPAIEHEIADSVETNAGQIVDNVNVITVINKINDNVEEVASYLCHLFGESPKKRGYYKNLRNTQGCTNSEAWLAATIETLLAVSRRRTNNPGGYFYKRCLSLHREGIPPQSLQLVRQYGSLTHQQLLEALQHPDQAVVPAVSPALPVMPGASSARRKVAAPAPVPVLIEARNTGRPGVSEDDYLQIRALLKLNLRTCLFRLVRKRQADGSCAILVDDSMKHQCWLYSLADCQVRLAGLRTSLDFFKVPTPDDMKNSASGN